MALERFNERDEPVGVVHRSNGHQPFGDTKLLVGERERLVDLRSRETGTLEGVFPNYQRASALSEWKRHVVTIPFEQCALQGQPGLTRWMTTLT